LEDDGTNFSVLKYSKAGSSTLEIESGFWYFFLESSIANEFDNQIYKFYCFVF
jgi:hypothetical protein